MAFSKAQALDAVKTVLEQQRLTEISRLDRIHEALEPHVSPGSFKSSVLIANDAPPMMRELERKAVTNYLPLAVKTFSQVMKVDGYITVGAEDENPWRWWQRNRMDSRQTGLVRSALSYGAGYATVLPGTYGRGEPGPAVSLFSPRELTALYQDPEADEWPMLAVSVDDKHVTLYDEEMVYRFGIESGVPFLPSAAAIAVQYGAGSLTYIDQQAHGVGVTPVVRYRDRNLLSGEEQYGIVEPLMTIQERINETTFQMSVAQYFQAFKQRYIIGWVPDSESEELKASAARLWHFEDDDVKVGELDGGDIAPYISSRESAIRDFSAIGQLPPQAFGIDGISNISDATLAGLEAAKAREASEITTSLGESHEQLFRLMAYIAGDDAQADDYSSEVRWKSFEARSFAQTVDGLGKLATMLGIPPAELLEDIPGFTNQRVDRIRDSLRTAEARATVASLTAAAGSAVQG